MTTAPRLAIVLKGYPRLSETFIAQEIHGLEQRGLAPVIVSLRQPHDPAIHPIHRQIQAPVLYLPEYLHDAPGRVARAWRAVRRRPGYGAARAAWLADLRRDPTRNRIRRFGQALVLAHELPASVAWLHVHFLHTPASVTRYAALITGLPWSVSAHAKDIWTSPDWEKREKLADCRWAVTCTAVNRDHLAALAPPGRVDLLYHGLDLDRFPPPGRREPTGPVTLLSVGRLVAKKGYDVLLHALARLPAGADWRLVHIGGGALAGDLRALADQLGLGNRIDWRGAQAQDAVLAAYRAADLFVLASRIAGDGDRDGLPNVLMEAQSQELPVVATAVSAIPELVVDRVTGRLVPPEDPEALAAALADLIADPDQRRALGQAGRQRVTDHFNFEPELDRLAARLGAAPDLAAD